MTAFFDTNIVVYAFLDVAKRERALDLIASGGVISGQVLNEFTNVARRKRQRDRADIERAFSVIRTRFPDIVPLTADTHAAAIEAGCDTLFSEDMQHSRVIGGLTIVNPFFESAR